MAERLLLPALMQAALSGSDQQPRGGSGLFVEVVDRQLGSHTLALERCFGWRGLIIVEDATHAAKLRISSLLLSKPCFPDIDAPNAHSTTCTCLRLTALVDRAAAHRAATVMQSNVCAGSGATNSSVATNESIAFTDPAVSKHSKQQVRGTHLLTQQRTVLRLFRCSLLSRCVCSCRDSQVIAATLVNCEPLARLTARAGLTGAHFLSLHPGHLHDRLFAQKARRRFEVNRSLPASFHATRERVPRRNVLGFDVILLSGFVAKFARTATSCSVCEVMWLSPHFLPPRDACSLLRGTPHGRTWPKQFASLASALSLR
eukprot:1367648-Prymnesium_polylepis.3